MSSTKNSRIIKAAPSKIYKALTTPDAIATWQAPGNMKARVHNFDLRVGGGYEMSLYYPENDKESRGKSAAKEDRFRSRFLEVSPGKIIQAINFETDNTSFQGEMIMEVSLTPKGGSTEVTFIFKNIPAGIKPEDNEAGTESSLQKLAAFVE